MARPREFDLCVVLELARNTFWSNGVAETSIADLSKATGLSVGSIYKAFESKAGLCHASLDDYLVRGLVVIAELLDEGDESIAGIETWLEAMALQAASTSPTRGCFAVNCATELAENDEYVRQRLRRHDREHQAMIAKALSSAVAAGDLAVDPSAGAMLLCTTVTGVQVESRKGITIEDARATLAMALDALRPR